MLLIEHLLSWFSVDCSRLLCQRVRGISKKYNDNKICTIAPLGWLEPLNPARHCTICPILSHRCSCEITGETETKPRVVACRYSLPVRALYRVITCENPDLLLRKVNQCLRTGCGKNMQATEGFRNRGTLHSSRYTSSHNIHA